MYIDKYMKKSLITYFMIFLSFIGHDQTLANEELLSLLNQVEHSEKLNSIDMGITAKEELKIALISLKKIDESTLTDFQKSFKNQLIDRAHKQLERDYSTLSSCNYLQKKHENELASMVDIKLKNREDFMKRWQKLKLIKMDIDSNGKCPSLKKLWTTIDSVENMQKEFKLI